MYIINYRALAANIKHLEVGLNLAKTVREEVRLTITKFVKNKSITFKHIQIFF